MAKTVIARRVGKFRTEVQMGEHRLTADEPRAAGGEGAGPDPYDLLLAALGACISMTVTLYSDRKGWPLEGVEVALSHRRVYAEDCADCGEREPGELLDRIERRVTFLGPLDPQQRQRLEEIAGKCPVHRTLSGNVVIVPGSSS
jgi:putative redox protein